MILIMYGKIVVEYVLANTGLIENVDSNQFI